MRETKAVVNSTAAFNFLKSWIYVLNTLPNVSAASSCAEVVIWAQVSGVKPVEK